MTTLTPSAFGQLSDQDLLAQVQLAAQTERQATAHLIALLMELDARRLYLGEGCSSLFTYCTQALHFSESAAYNRIEAARAARRYPVILELLAAGAVTLTAVRLLAPHLTPDNHREVLARARHNSKRDVELLVARLNPRPDVPPTIRKLPTVAGFTASAPSTDEEQRAANGGGPASFAPPKATSQKHLADMKPLAPERYKIQFTVSRETYQQLRRAQDLLRHTVPDGDPAIIFDRALTLLVAELERTKIGATERPRAARRTNATSRHIPAAIRRTVWQRDAGRCAFTGTNGRCKETGFLEYHHVVPFAAGGETSVRNLQLRCRAHNQHEADRYFAPAQAPLLRERRAFFGTGCQLVLERVAVQLAGANDGMDSCWYGNIVPHIEESLRANAGRSPDRAYDHRRRSRKVSLSGRGLVSAWSRRGRATTVTKPVPRVLSRPCASNRPAGSVRVVSLWARELQRLGHTVRLLPAHDVHPYLRRNQTESHRRQSTPRGQS